MRTTGIANRTVRVIRPSRALGLLAIAAAALAVLSGSAQAAEIAPAWKVAAATGPTHLPPVQSEVQQLTVEAEAGTFTLSQPVTGEAHRSFGRGFLTFVAGSDVATFTGASNPFEAGQEVIRSTANRLPLGAKVLAAETGGGSGSTVEFDTLPNSAGASSVFASSKVLSDVEGTFYEGETVTGEGIPAATTVTAVDPVARTLTISDYPLAGGTFPLSTVRATGALPYDASAADVQAALEALPGYGAGSVSVSGGPGGDARRPFVLAYGGAHANEDVPQLVADAGALTGAKHYATVVTALPGGPGTGEIVVYPTNVGGKRSEGTITVTVGPLPGGIVVAGAAGGLDWTCTNTATEATCESSESVPAGEVISPLGVPVEVGPLAPSSAAVGVAVSGGGAARATASAPIEVSRDPAPFGIASFWAGAFEADGRPATQAGGHPYSDMTWFMVNTDRSRSGQIVPAGDVKDVDADLQAGFLGNPLITATRCPQGLLLGGAGSVCEAGAEVGILRPNVIGLGQGGDYLPGNPQLINDVPALGSAAEFTARFGSPYVTLFGSVRSSEDFGIRVSSPHVPSTVSKAFVTFVKFTGFPEGSGKAFFRNATDCAAQAVGAPSVGLQANSWQDPTFHAASDRQPPVTGCDKLRFGPQFSLQPTSTQGSAGVGVNAHLHIDQSGLTDPDKLGTPDLKRSVVTLPAGLAVNPSQANGLEACSEAQVGYMPGAAPVALNPTRFNEAPVTCPDGSKLGTVEATTPLLEEPLKGTIYLARQDENPFHTLIGLYLVFESHRFGVTLKLPGKAELDPRTGQITAVFDYVPQQPVEDLTLHFRGGGPRSEFATPEVCGTYATHGTWTPWSAPESGPPAQTSDPFTVSSGCSGSAAARPFHPAFEAGSVGPLAAAYSPLVIKVDRADGEGELRSLDFSLPPGESARLAGVPYCPESAIAAAGARTGREELASPSCPAASRIGTVDAAAGVGPRPFHTAGAVYLAGPYKGAPISAVVVTPAVAGPFDLGNVVIRSPLFIDPVTAQVTAKSDPIPTILRGIPLKLRSVAIKVDRGGFSLNPTNCEAMSVTATVRSSDGARATPANRFQVGGCDKLKFKPRLKLRLKGATRRTGHPKLKAVVTFPKKGRYANIARAQVGLPHAEFLDQGNLDKVCKQADLQAGTCPKRSIYGHAKAWTPLLDKPLQGPVYLGVGFGYKLPALVADLNGQIRILLVGRIDTTKSNGIRNTFEVVPDAPVSRFVLTMKGGKKYGLLENSENVCKKKQRASAVFNAQNGLRLHLRPKINYGCKGGKRSRKSKDHSKSRAKRHGKKG